MYLNLFVKTEYSYLDSLIKLKDYIEYAKENKLDSLAICDTTLAGAYTFYNMCIDNGIKPIIGLCVEVESIVNQSTKFLMFAKNNEGYANLMKLSSKAAIVGKVEFSDLLGNVKGIRVVSYDNSEILYNENKAVKFIRKYQQTFEEYYIGLNFVDDSTEILFELSEKCEANIVYVKETAYFSLEDKKYLQVLNAIKRGRILSEIEQLKDMHYLEEQEINVLPKYEKAIHNTQKFKKTDISFDESYKLPHYEKKGINDNFVYLKALCTKGLERRLDGNLKAIDDYAKRLAYELEVIKKMGFVDYFLIVYDFILVAKRDLQIYVGPGRGSSASSLVSYCLGITNVDPLKYGLMFERFLNVERISMPDIDIDFPDDKREEVINYVRDKYGKYHVATIQTYNKFLGKSSIRDVAKTMNLSHDKLERALKHIPNTNNSVAAALKETETLELIQAHNEQYLLFDYAKHIEGLIKNTSTHAAGILITDKVLTDYTPICINKSGGIQTQYEAKCLEKLGLLKMDFLGLRNLSVINETTSIIIEQYNNKFDINNIPLKDPKTLELLSKGNTLGVFQLESTGMQRMLKNMQITDFSDLFFALALYRPGPSENIDEFILRKHNEKEVVYLHKNLKPILEESYGIILYQEQIIKILAKFGGYNYAQADVVRKAISKKNEKMLLSEKDKFITGGKSLGYSFKLLEQLFDYIMKFANYGFNKAHSVAYSLVTYQTAYLKANYPQVYMTVLMSYLSKDHSLMTYKRECMKMGIRLENPSINLSTDKYIFKDRSLILPLTSINGIRKELAQKIVEIRESKEEKVFTSYRDFIDSTRDIINMKIFKNLVFSCALDDFDMHKIDMIGNYEIASKRSSFGQIDTFTEIIKPIEVEYDDNILENNEKEALGVNIRFNFIKKYDKIIKEFQLQKLSDLDNTDSINVLVKINNVKVVKTKYNDNMAFLDIEDDTNVVSVIMFPKIFETKSGIAVKDTICMLKLLHVKNKAKESIQVINIREV